LDTVRSKQGVNYGIYENEKHPQDRLRNDCRSIIVLDERMHGNSFPES
jgi:hypothetical protein